MGGAQGGQSVHCPSVDQRSIRFSQPRGSRLNSCQLRLKKPFDLELEKEPWPERLCLFTPYGAIHPLIPRNLKKKKKKGNPNSKNQTKTKTTHHFTVIIIFVGSRLGFYLCSGNSVVCDSCTSTIQLSVPLPEREL